MSNKHLPVINNVENKEIINNPLIEEEKIDYKPRFTTKILDTNKEHISFSEMVQWIECPFRHRLKYIDNIILDGPTEHTEFGQVIHDAMEYYLHNRVMPDYNLVREQFNEHLSKVTLKAPLNPKEWHDTIEPILEEAKAFLDTTFPGWEYNAAEFELMEEIIGQTKKFKGYIDGIIRVPKKARKGSSVIPEGYDYFLIDWKGQRLSAPILTPNGWVTMGSLKIGDEITSSNGGICKVEGIFPLGKKDVYRITFRDGAIVDCTEDHLWKASNGTTTKILTTKELISNKQYKFIPVLSNPVEFSGENLFTIDPYLLGILIGDGCFRGGIRFSTADIEIVKNVAAILPKTINLKKVGNSKYDYGLTVDISCAKSKNPIINELRKFGLMDKMSFEKFIPKNYLFSSPVQRLELLQGLLDTDGWVQKGCAKFSTTSKQLSIDVKHLVGSLGGVAFISCRKKKRNPSEYMEYIVTVRLPKNMKPFKLTRKLKKWNNCPTSKLQRSISKIEKIGQDDMQCIGVSSNDHLYVTNDFILTHNTTGWGWSTDKKIDPNKTLQLVLYKYFWSKKMGIDVTDIKCGFVLLKRTAKVKCEFVPVSVGEKSIQRGIDTMNKMLGYLKKGFYPKYRGNSCRYCKYAGTEYCL